jgi:hypothetical protein
MSQLLLFLFLPEPKLFVKPNPNAQYDLQALRKYSSS